MYKKGRFGDLPFFDTVQEILSHYSPPSTCPAICCKIADINLDEKDLEILRLAPKYNACKVETCNDSEEHQYKLSPPCPFLKSDRCSVYDHRPTMCRMFPFNISNKPDILLLFPCDMGACIFEDYIEYSNKILNCPVPAKTISEFKQANDSFLMKLTENLPVPMLMFKVDSLIPFKEYLRLKYR
jgi:Fe-S-cluster containining protein